MNKMLALLMISLIPLTAHAEFDSEAYLRSVDRGDYDSVDNPPQTKFGFNRTAFSDCLLEHSKGAQTSGATIAITTACRIKATPKKCRQLSAIADNSKSKSPQLTCYEECQSASFYSGKFGDCSLN